MAGIDVLKAGGSAIDAAIAANVMLSLVEPMSCGPGGDLFAIVWSEKDQKLFGLNASGRSPYDWTLQQALDLGLKEIPVYHPLSWSVPGLRQWLGGPARALRQAQFARLLEPTIEMARNGFPLSPIIAQGWLSATSSDHPGLKSTYLPMVEPMYCGTIFKNSRLCVGLRDARERGARRAFYQGDIGERIVKFFAGPRCGVLMRDFHEHKADWSSRSRHELPGLRRVGRSPNGQGIATLQMLNLLEHFDIGSMLPNSAEHLHLFHRGQEARVRRTARSTTAGHGLRQGTGCRRLISKDYAARRVKLIDPPRSGSGRARPAQGSSDTTYLTAADADGTLSR